MKVFLSESTVVVNNSFENCIFVYDRFNHTKYDINLEMFELLKEVKYNKLDYEKLVDKYGNDIISELMKLNILVTQEQRDIFNIKELHDYNCARIFVELTDKCNLKCKHCYGNFESCKTSMIDIEVLKKVIDQAKENNVYEFDLTGGEPLLYPKLEELLSYLFEAGMLVSIFTNLTLLTDKWLKIFKKYGLKKIITSIDSNQPEVHNNFRGQKGAFERTLKNIEKIKNSNIELAVNTMIGNHNKDHIDNLVCFLKSLDVTSVLDVIVQEGRAVMLDENINVSSNIIKYIYLKYTDNIDRNSIQKNCGIGNRFIFIKSSGEIYICPNLITKEYSVGNVNENNLENIFSDYLNSMSFKDFIKANRKVYVKYLPNYPYYYVPFMEFVKKEVGYDEKS